MKQQKRKLSTMHNARERLPQADVDGSAVGADLRRNGLAVLLCAQMDRTEVFSSVRNQMYGGEQAAQTSPGLACRARASAFHFSLTTTRGWAALAKGAYRKRYAPGQVDRSRFLCQAVTAPRRHCLALTLKPKP